MLRRGFTILELSLVLAVILILAAITLPSIETMYEDARLEAAADQVRARWADARSRAVDDGVPYRFSVATQSGRFKVEPDTDMDGGDGQQGESKPLIISDELPGGVIFVDASVANDDSSGDLQSVVIFLANGEARDDSSVTLRGKSSRTLKLELRALTGAVKISFSNGEE